MRDLALPEAAPPEAPAGAACQYLQFCPLGAVALGRVEAGAPWVGKGAGIAFAAGAALLPGPAGAVGVRIRAVAALGASASSKQAAELGLG